MCYTVDFRIYNLQPFSEADNQFHRYFDLSENEHTCFKQSVQCAGRANKIKNDVNLIYHTDPNVRKKDKKKTKFNIAVSSVQVSRLHLSRYKNYLILKTRNAERCVCD